MLSGTSALFAHKAVLTNGTRRNTYISGSAPASLSSEDHRKVSRDLKGAGSHAQAGAAVSPGSWLHFRQVDYG